MNYTCPTCGLSSEATLTHINEDGWNEAEFICAGGHGFSVSWPVGQT